MTLDASLMLLGWCCAPPKPLDEAFDFRVDPSVLVVVPAVAGDVDDDDAIDITLLAFVEDAFVESPAAVVIVVAVADEAVVDVAVPPVAVTPVIGFAALSTRKPTRRNRSPLVIFCPQ